MKSKRIFLSLLLIASTITFTACSQSTPEAEASTTESIESIATLPDEFATANNKFARMEQVDDALSELCQDKEFKKADDDKQAELALKLLKELESKGLIKKDSISYDKNGLNISFDYIDGVGGGFMLREFDSRFN
ncbi:MAG: hypothetical protein UHY68_08460 [Acutalibacteraceae bacterium]|nr:hypothetical protein [Acutalibacteraceae bacterium]